MRSLKAFFWFTDLGFILYWSATALHLIPLEYAFNDYQDPILVAWNWSFFPLDMLISLSGLSSLYLHARGHSSWRSLAVVSLTLTLVAGLNALSFWTLRGDFSLEWWLPNLYLTIYPLFYLRGLIGVVPWSSSKHKA